MATWLGYGQNEALFEASTDAQRVSLNTYFDVNFNLKNANGTQFAPPSFKDFIVAAGPSTSSQMTIVKGVVKHEMTFSYTLQPTKVG